MTFEHFCPYDNLPGSHQKWFELGFATAWSLIKSMRGVLDEISQVEKFATRPGRNWRRGKTRRFLEGNTTIRVSPLSWLRKPFREKTQISSESDQSWGNKKGTAYTFPVVNKLQDGYYYGEPTITGRSIKENHEELSHLIQNEVHRA